MESMSSKCHVSGATVLRIAFEQPSVNVLGKLSAVRRISFLGAQHCGDKIATWNRGRVTFFPPRPRTYFRQKASTSCVRMRFSVVT